MVRALTWAWQAATLPLWLAVVSSGSSWQYGTARLTLTPAPTAAAVARFAAIPGVMIAAATAAGARPLFALAVVAAPSMIETTAAAIRARRLGIVSVAPARRQLHAAGVRDVLEVGNLVGGTHPSDTVILLRRLLRGVDTAGVGLAATARDTTRDKYLRLGFHPVPGAPRTLTRAPTDPPGGSTTTTPSPPAQPGRLVPEVPVTVASAAHVDERLTEEDLEARQAREVTSAAFLSPLRQPHRPHRPAQLTPRDAAAAAAVGTGASPTPSAALSPTAHPTTPTDPVTQPDVTDERRSDPGVATAR